MKRCSKCGETKPLDEFQAHRRSRDGKQPWCATCQNSYTAKVKQPIRSGRAEWLIVYKLMRGCHVCGYARSPAALDFHHRDPATKEFTLGGSSGVNSIAWERVEAELEKCDVICSNCHRELHNPFPGATGIDEDAPPTATSDGASTAPASTT